MKIRWKFRNLTDLVICFDLIYHQIQNMFLNVEQNNDLDRRCEDEVFAFAMVNR